jgi:hypothetical protein
VSERLLTAREVADRYRVHPETVLRWHRLGYVPAVRLPGTARGRLQFREADLDAYDAAHTTAAPVREAPTPHSGAAEARVSFPVPTPSPRLVAASTEKENSSDATL